MKHDDEEIQKQVELGLSESKTPAHDTYQKIFDALKQEPDYDLPVYFADRVVNRIIQQREEKTRRDHLWLITGLIGIFVVFIITLILTLTMTSVTLQFGFLAHLLEYKWLLLTGAILVTVFNWLDKRILRQVESF